MESPPIIVKQEFNVTLQEVWAALTEKEKMQQWFFPQINAFEAIVGFETSFDVAATTRNFFHIWKIKEVDKPYKLVVNWMFGGFTADADVEFQLENQGDKTLLTVTVIGIDNFPQDIPEFKRESCKGGWEYFIQQQLTNYFNSQ